MVPSVAEFMYLDKIKWLEMYGVDLHPVKVSDIFKHMLILKVCRITEELCLHIARYTVYNLYTLSH